MTTVPPFDPLSFHAAALTLRSHRQGVLASNLANADTPGYQARDLNFADALGQVMQGGPVRNEGRMVMVGSDVRHLGPVGGTDAPALLYRTALQPSIDGNTVDPDVERAHFAENTMGFELATALLSQTVKSRQMAITGQP